MPAPDTLATRLLPELTHQLAMTRKVLAAVPDGHNDFAAHPKSMPLTRLAGHTAELAGFAYFLLTLPGINMGTPEDPRKILRMTTRDELLAEYDPSSHASPKPSNRPRTPPGTRPSPSPAKAPSSAKPPATRPTATCSSTT